MVYKRSEYGHQFKVSSLQKNIPVYQENLTYRSSRRDREFAHTPIAWDNEPIEESDSDERLSPDKKIEELPVSDMAIIDEGEESEESEEEEDEIAIEKKAALEKDRKSQEQVCDSPDVEITRQSDQLGKQARAKLNKFVTKEIEDNLDQPVKVKEASEKKSLGKTFVKPKKAGEAAFSKCLRPRRPDRQNKIPKQRPKSAPGSRRPESREDVKKPFVAYGCGGLEADIGDQKTFNVRASSAVYPAAIRAQRRNRLAAEKRQERERVESAREKKKKALFNERMARETISWASEYHRAFPKYEDTQYVTTERDPRRQKSYFTK